MYDLKEPRYYKAKNRTILGDIRDKQRLIDATEECSIIFHLATIPPSSHLSKKEIYDIEIEGTKNIIEAALKNGIKKIIFCSSCSHVYGIQPPENIPTKESASLNPINEYGKNKVRAEKLLMKASEKNELTVIVLRLSMVVGKYNSDPILIENVKKMLKNKNIFIPGKGNTINQSVHVNDVNQALFSAAKIPVSRLDGNNVFNISGAEVLTVNEWMKLAKKSCNSKSKLLHLPVFLSRFIVNMGWIFNATKIHPSYIRLLNTDQYFDISRAEKILGWSPKHRALEGIKETVEFLIK
ncbi:MAG: NAD(P)-dependent oxidoreductase [Candidatus Thermoplasmatota archaeon]